MNGGPVRIEHVRRGPAVQLVIDGTEMTAFEGEVLSTALLAAGRMTFRRSEKLREPRGLFCSIGICFECVVRVEGLGTVRACQTAVRNGMRVETITVGMHS
ncbi:MAG TPA: (2Fe-2S)-binding protein [bacterium]|nr:(2Fe-2S)-binding protein [bacterium]